MSSAAVASRAKAVRLCGRGSPSMRRQREDGGSTGNDSSAGNPTEMLAPPLPSPAPSVEMKPKDGTDPTVAIKIGAPTEAKPLNAQAAQHGGRAGR